MSFSLDIDQTRGLNNLERLDIIEYQSERISLDKFMILQIEKDESIPAVLLQLWKFKGGYDHAVFNIMENDLGVNKQVTYFVPNIKKGIIRSITSYRNKNTDLSKKEIFIFDVWPDSESPTKNEEHQIPFRVNVELENKTKELIIPQWTPIQRLPYTKIKKGSVVEVWTVGDHTNIMKVLNL